METRSFPKNSAPRVHDLFPISLPWTWHIPRSVSLRWNSQERKSDRPNHLWARGHSRSITVAMGLTFVMVDIFSTGDLVDTWMNVSYCHTTSLAETGFDFRFVLKSSAFLLPRGWLIEKHIKMACNKGNLPFSSRSPQIKHFLHRVLLLLFVLTSWFLRCLWLHPGSSLSIWFLYHVAWLLILLMQVLSLAHLANSDSQIARAERIYYLVPSCTCAVNNQWQHVPGSYGEHCWKLHTSPNSPDKCMVALFGFIFPIFYY